MRTRFIYFPPEILIPNLGEEIDHNRFLDQILKKVSIDGMKSSIKKKTSRKLGGEEISRYCAVKSAYGFLITRYYR